MIYYAFYKNFKSRFININIKLNYMAENAIKVPLSEFSDENMISFNLIVALSKTNSKDKRSLH